MDLLEKKSIQTDLKIIKTSGDLFLDRPLHKVSGRGIFVREIDERMLSGEINLAVHSMKDLPSMRPDQLPIAAVLKRDSPYDVLASENGRALDEMEDGAIVGTSSMRRSAQLKRARPDIIIRGIRGNLGTRLRKLREEEFDAIVLAEAGIQRMGYEVKHSKLDIEKFVPSPNQGVIAVVAYAGSIAEKAARSIDDETTRIETMAERCILDMVGGGCVVPMSAYAKREDDKLRMMAEVLSLDGDRYVRVDEQIPVQDYLQHSMKLGKKLARMGGSALVEEAVRIVEAR